jgi:hypothetical protein
MPLKKQPEHKLLLPTARWQQEREMYDISREDLAPYRETGYTALQDITKRMPLFTSQFGDEQMAQYLDPSMEFRRNLASKPQPGCSMSAGALSAGTPCEV